MDAEAKWKKLREVTVADIDCTAKDVDDADIRYAGFLHGRISGLSATLAKMDLIEKM